MKTNTNIITVHGLKKYYGSGPRQVKALDGIDLTIKQGEFTAITGASGSGKMARKLKITEQNNFSWTTKAVIQSCTLVWAYILQNPLWNNIMVNLY